MKHFLLFITFALTSVMCVQVNAVDSGGSEGISVNDNYNKTNINDPFSKARSLIGKREYKRAIRELNAIISSDHRNADAWNLIGYSNRKLGNFEEAGKAYRKALKYDPNHKGALEYQGQLFVSLNDMQNAQANREKLASLCPDGCDELDKLTAAIASKN